ncbi:MAG: arylsulfatase [Actinomycetota bacterium]
MTDRPNIVMIMVDQWRADHFGIDGHPVVETPNIDMLFGRGTVFDRAYAAVPSCIAARASLLTGLDHRRHGRVGYQAEVAWNYPFTLASVLADGGYLCHAVGKMHVWPARRRMGFHDVDLHDGYTIDERRKLDNFDQVDDYRTWLRLRSQVEADIVDAGLGCNGYDVRPWPMDDRLHPNAWAVTRAVDFLRRRDPTMPFFLKVSFHRPHPPIDPPQWALDRYCDVTLPPLIEAGWNDRSGPPRPGYFLESPVPTSPAAVDRARRGYYAQLTAIDNELNRLVHALNEHGLAHNTAFVLLGDHGEMLYDHWRVAKNLPYEGSARVPMMVRLPGAPHAVRRSSAVVELMDVLPTMCELAGVETPIEADGHSLVPLTSCDQTAPRSTLHGEHFNWASSARVSDDNQWITDERFKYVWFPRSGREQLFDLGDDPDECIDLANERSDALDRLRAALVVALEGREEGYVHDGELVAGRVGRATLEEAGIMSADQQQRQRDILDWIGAR